VNTSFERATASFEELAFERRRHPCVGRACPGIRAHERVRSRADRVEPAYGTNIATLVALVLGEAPELEFDNHACVELAVVATMSLDAERKVSAFLFS
jgi:hypothetical protein